MNCDNAVVISISQFQGVRKWGKSGVACMNVDVRKLVSCQVSYSQDTDLLKKVQNCEVWSQICFDEITCAHFIYHFGLGAAEPVKIFARK